MSGIYLSRFTVLDPQFMGPQEVSLEWLLAAHLRAEETLRLERGEAFDRERVEGELRAAFGKYGVKPEQIAVRGTELADFSHTDWERMSVYRLHEDACGETMDARMAVHRESVDRVFHAFYPPAAPGPNQLLHVTCTGYASPSPAQFLADERNWHRQTRVKHLYHMGCYAALPATEIATSLVADGAHSVDLVHTELCTLQLDPSIHTAEQIIVQTLFADGLVKYTCSTDLDPAADGALEVLAHDEQLLENSTADMTWELGAHCMRMRLSKEVPLKIAPSVREVIDGLLLGAGVNPKTAYPETLFAVHPGGPRIIDGVKAMLELREDQVADSREVLRTRGNMSSATLPHVWERLLTNPASQAGQRVVSMAFGPGLTVAASLMRVVR